MAQLQGAKIFTKLDLCWGYNNVRIKEGDEYKTAFRTKYRLFKTLVMPFSLTNAPTAFQHFMNDIFRDRLDTKIVVYLDDILIFSKNQEDHERDVREVLRRLMANQLFCKLSKCSFHVDTVDYLGLVISPIGISMEEKKVQVVKEWPTPQNAMGAVLSQRQEDGRLHPIAYMSQSFNGAEHNYNTHDKEHLAIIKSLEFWRIFLEGTKDPITVFTDHRNLEYWQESRMFNHRHTRWHLLLTNTTSGSTTDQESSQGNQTHYHMERTT
jgi:hypothetical protein